MRRSKHPGEFRRTHWFSGRRRIVVLTAAMVALGGGIATVTQVSNAATNREGSRRSALSVCDRMTAPRQAPVSNTRARRGEVADDGAGEAATTAQLRQRCRQWVAQNVGNDEDVTTNAETKAGNGRNRGRRNGGNGGNGNRNNNGNNGNNGNGNGNGNGNNDGGAVPPGAGLGVLTNSCKDSQLEAHDGFQKGDRCVSTEFGEVSSAANNPSLLIVDAPQRVGVNQAFTLTVSSRNLIRDRFLAAGAGGYYVESSVLNNGIERGHFHTACRIIPNTNQAPPADPVPAFFVATEDNKGGRGEDKVQVQVPGLPQAGTFQCASWSGDGSHRIPMMERANETPAFDTVRIQVVNGGNNQNNNGQNNNRNRNRNRQNNNNGQNNNGNRNGQNNNGQNDNGNRNNRNNDDN